MRLSLLLVLFACGVPPARSETEPDVAFPPYDGVVEGIEAARVGYAARYAAATPEERPVVMAEARAYVEKAVLDDLFPQWFGTDWEFYGTTTTPRQGSIACGYFVSTVLEDAGFRVERVPLAQQASERIILSLVPKDGVRRYSWATGQEVVDAVRAEGDGLYLLGLDYHVAFLAVRSGDVRMCHSSYVGTGAVACEDALTSPAMESDYRVTGKLFAEPMMGAWLEGRAIGTVTR